MPPDSFITPTTSDSEKLSVAVSSRLLKPLLGEQPHRANESRRSLPGMELSPAQNQKMSPEHKGQPAVRSPPDSSPLSEILVHLSL